MKNEIYKNAPLIETIFEIRFPSEPAIECNRDKFYELIRNVYSKILISTSSRENLEAIEQYRFEQDDGSKGIMLSINSVGVYCRKYEGFKFFKKEVMEVFNIFDKLFKVQKLQRTGLRYINLIPFTRENNIIPIKHYLNINIDLPNSISNEFENLSIYFVSKTGGGNITTRIEPTISEDRIKEVIILDFDYAKEGNLNFDSIEKYLDESHEHTKYLFEKLITEEYKKVMRGEVI